MKQVEMWETTDKTVFSDKAEAEEHERKIYLGSKIEDFFGSPLVPYDATSRTAAVMRTTIECWEKFCNMEREDDNAIDTD